MPRIKLTAHAVVTLSAPTPGGKQVVHWDTDLRGFGVLCSGKTNAKTYIVQRDLPGGNSRRVTIAKINEMKFADAKDKAREFVVDHAPREGPEGEAENRHPARDLRGLSVICTAQSAYQAPLRQPRADTVSIVEGPTTWLHHARRG
jgi:hypothetical protein